MRRTKKYKINVLINKIYLLNNFDYFICHRAGCCSGLDSPENEHQGLSPFGLVSIERENDINFDLI